MTITETIINEIQQPSYEINQVITTAIVYILCNHYEGVIPLEIIEQFGYLESRILFNMSPAELGKENSKILIRELSGTIDPMHKEYLEKYFGIHYEEISSRGGGYPLEKVVEMLSNLEHEGIQYLSYTKNYPPETIKLLLSLKTLCVEKNIEFSIPGLDLENLYQGTPPPADHANNKWKFGLDIEGGISDFPDEVTLIPHRRSIELEYSEDEKLDDACYHNLAEKLNEMMKTHNTSVYVQLEYSSGGVGTKKLQHVPLAELNGSSEYRKYCVDQFIKKDILPLLKDYGDGRGLPQHLILAPEIVVDYSPGVSFEIDEAGEVKDITITGQKLENSACKGVTSWVDEQYVTEDIKKKIIAAAQSYGRHLHQKYGHIGASNLDFVVSNGNVYVVESNTRFTAGTNPKIIRNAISLRYPNSPSDGVREWIVDDHFKIPTLWHTDSLIKLLKDYNIPVLNLRELNGNEQKDIGVAFQTGNYQSINSQGEYSNEISLMIFHKTQQEVEVLYTQIKNLISQ